MSDMFISTKLYELYADYMDNSCSGNCIFEMSKRRSEINDSRGITFAYFNLHFIKDDDKHQISLHLVHLYIWKQDFF